MAVYDAAATRGKPPGRGASASPALRALPLRADRDGEGHLSVPGQPARVLLDVGHALLQPLSEAIGVVHDLRQDGEQTARHAQEVR
eukprot:CAMPEP_0179205288 /NCGR_PEP_ID=MMETSP0796-20121207/102342_1 /TAXON_ID=73915 /ORGANISM="Pyrodinium bahamense, Strain pbaha01" /LENGTH=85 /DNA_ID=CAMNT_0020910173 /DNA_START=133 /DNA_END=391 /DNA_ORIENTATION=+